MTAMLDMQLRLGKRGILPLGLLAVDPSSRLIVSTAAQIVRLLTPPPPSAAHRN